MRKQTFIFLVLMTLCTAVANADVYLRPKYVRHEMNDGAVSPPSEDATKLVDDDYSGNTKWCVLGFSSVSIEVTTVAPVKVKYLRLRTGNDTKDNSWRNWKDFNVYGQNDLGAWELIKAFKDFSIPALNKEIKDVELNAQKFYQNYKVEVLANSYLVSPLFGNKTEIQMSDMQFGLDETSVVRPEYMSHKMNQEAVSPAGEDATKLVDDDKTGFGTKWYAYNFTSGHIMVDAKKKIRINALILNNGYDTDKSPARRWKNFKIYGINSNREWEEIYNFHNQNLPTDRSPYIYLPLLSEDAYRYYMVEILNVMGGGEMQMGDMLFSIDNTPTPKYEEVEIRPAYYDATYYKFDSYSEGNSFPWKLVDEAGTGTSWGPGSDANVPQNVVVDAGQPCRLNSIKLYAPATDAPEEKNLSISVYGSDDANPYLRYWQKLFETEKGAVWNPKGSPAFVAEVNSKTEYRYYKIVKSDTCQVSLISDMKFVITKNVNPATSYRTFTPEYKSGSNAAAVVDGKPDTYWTAKKGDYIIVDAKHKIKLYGFELYNTPNSEANHGAQWKDYDLYGADSPDASAWDWKLLRSFENRYLKTKNGTLAAANVVDCNKEYQYYKLVFQGSVKGGDAPGQLGGLKLVHDGSGAPSGPDLTLRLMTENTHRLAANEVVVVDKDLTITGTEGRAPLRADETGITIIQFENNATLTLTAAPNSPYPGLWIPKGALVVLRGNGTLNATGGSGIAAHSGQNGSKGTESAGQKNTVNENNHCEGGKGGNGGTGGTGAAAGIGGVGGTGGPGGTGGAMVGVSSSGNYSSHKIGTNGQNGARGTDSGDLIVTENVKVKSTSGQVLPVMAAGGLVGAYGQYHGGIERLGTGGGGGGAGGEGALPAYAYCAGGGGGGGGGAGGNSGFAVASSSSLTVAEHIDAHYDNASHGGAGGKGREASHGQNGQTQYLKEKYNKKGEGRANWNENGWNEIYRAQTYDRPVRAGGAMGENGSNGMVYCLGSDNSVQPGSTGVTDMGNVVHKPDVATLKTLFQEKNAENIFKTITYDLTLNPARGCVFRNGENGPEMGSTITYYSSMPMPLDLMVTVPKNEKDEVLEGFIGFFFNTEEGNIQAFDRDGKITAEFRNMLLSYVDKNTYIVKETLRNGFTLYPSFSDEAIVTVNHWIKDFETNKDQLVNTQTSSEKIKDGETVSFIVSPFVTITKEGETPDTLVCDDKNRLRLSAEAFTTDFQTQTVTLSREDKQKTINIVYTTRGMKYTLNDSELATYGASFYGNYTQTNDGMRVKSTITLPRVAFKQAGADGAYYRLAGWQSSAQEDLISEDAISYSMPPTAVSLKPVFEKSGLIAIATKKKPEDDQRIWSDSCSVLLHPDNTLYNNSTIAMAGDEQFEKIYVNIFNPIGARLNSLTAEMTAIEGTSEIRTIELVSKESVETEDKCYFLKPADWTKGEGEYYPIVYLTAVFEEDRKAARVQYVGNFSQSGSPSADAPQMPVVALSADGRHFYYDDAVFDVLAKQEGCVKAGSLSEFDFGYEDQIGVYITNAGNLDNVSITATPANVSLPAGETSAWDLQCVSTEPMTCLKFKASTYDDVTITVKAGSSSPAAIEQIEAENSADRIIYDLDGHRVGYLRRGAVVIENGNKYIVR